MFRQPFDLMEKVSKIAIRTIFLLNQRSFSCAVENESLCQFNFSTEKCANITIFRKNNFNQFGYSRQSGPLHEIIVPTPPEGGGTTYSIGFLVGLFKKNQSFFNQSS